jgi:hypothetical protein
VCILTHQGWILGFGGIWRGGSFSFEVVPRSVPIKNSLFPNHEWAFGVPQTERYTTNYPGLTVNATRHTVGVHHWLITLALFLPAVYAHYKKRNSGNSLRSTGNDTPHKAG